MLSWTIHILQFQELFRFSQFAVCMPSTCSEEDINILFARDSFKDMALGLLIDDSTHYHLYLVNDCQSEADDTVLTSGDKAFV